MSRLLETTNSPDRHQRTGDTHDPSSAVPDHRPASGIDEGHREQQNVVQDQLDRPGSRAGHVHHACWSVRCHFYGGLRQDCGAVPNSRSCFQERRF